MQGTVKMAVFFYPIALRMAKTLWSFGHNLSAIGLDLNSLQESVQQLLCHYVFLTLCKK